MTARKNRGTEISRSRCRAYRKRLCRRCREEAMAVLGADGSLGGAVALRYLHLYPRICLDADNVVVVVVHLFHCGTEHLTHAQRVHFFCSVCAFEALYPERHGGRGELREHHLSGAEVTFEMSECQLVVTSRPVLSVVYQSPNVLTCVVAETNVGIPS